MNEMSINSGFEGKRLRCLFTLLMLCGLVLTLVFNGLAGSQSSPFINSPGNVSDRFEICVVPAGYTFSIWGLIYTLLVLLGIYAVLILFRKVGSIPVWQLGGIISAPFLISLTLNFIFNISWLFAWDRENPIAASVLLYLAMITSNIAIVTACITFKKTGAALYDSSKFHFWANVFLINAYNVYDMWLIIAAQLNLFMAINSQSDGSGEATLCIIFLCVILVAFIAYFIAEHTVLLELGNPLISHYAVYLWAFVGIYNKNKDFANDSVVNLIITNIFFAAFFLVARAISIAVINRNNRFYKNK